MTQALTLKDREDLLNKLKDRYHAGFSASSLVRTTQGRDESTMKLQWMFSAGMGNTDFMDAKPEVVTIAHELLKEGKLAPAIPFPYYNLHVQPLKLVEDLNWALDKSDSIVLFELSRDRTLPDLVIRPDAQYDAAIEQVRKRLQYNTAMIDEPIRVSSGEQLRPVLMGHNAIDIRQRQLSP